MESVGDMAFALQKCENAALSFRQGGARLSKKDFRQPEQVFQTFKKV